MDALELQFLRLVYQLSRDGQYSLAEVKEQIDKLLSLHHCRSCDGHACEEED